MLAPLRDLPLALRSGDRRPRPHERTEYLRGVPLFWRGDRFPARATGAAHVQRVRVIDLGQGVLP